MLMPTNEREERGWSRSKIALGTRMALAASDRTTDAARAATAATSRGATGELPRQSPPALADANGAVTRRCWRRVTMPSDRRGKDMTRFR